MTIYNTTVLSGRFWRYCTHSKAGHEHVDFSRLTTLVGLEILTGAIVQRVVRVLFHLLDRDHTAALLYLVVQDVVQSDVRSIAVWSGWRLCRA